MLIPLAELAGLVAAAVALGVVSRTPDLLPNAARWPMLGLLCMLTFNHLANTLEQFDRVWADVAADHLSIATPLLWGLFLLEIGRSHLSSRVQAGEEQLQFFLEKLPVSIASLRDNGSLEAFSQAWQRAFPASMAGRLLVDVLTTPLPQLQAAVQRCAALGVEESVRQEVGIDAAGNRRYYRWAVRAFWHPDHPQPGVLLILEDLTSEVEAEAKLVAAGEELASLRRIGDLGQLAAGAAHDLNNLLQIIQAALWQLEAEGRSGEAVDAIRSAVETASAMTHTMLHVGRGAPAWLGPVDLAALLQQMHGPLSHALGRRHELVVDAPNQTRVMIRGNPARLQQALLNLVVNARDAMPRGGPIHISVEAHPQQAVLSVRDTGHGISEDVRARLFTPFFTTKGPNGTGLGLGVVRSAIEELKGEVVVESELGVGTTFHLRIPRLEEPLG